MSTDELARARGKAAAFQSEVEGHVKRYRPTDLVPALATRVEQSFATPALLSSFPPHFLLHAMEASCAFHRSAYAQPITENGIRRLVNVYHAYHSPTLDYILRDQKSLDLFFILTARS